MREFHAFWPTAGEQVLGKMGRSDAGICHASVNSPNKWELCPGNWQAQRSFPAHANRANGTLRANMTGQSMREYVLRGTVRFLVILPLLTATVTRPAVFTADTHIDF